MDIKTRKFLIIVSLFLLIYSKTIYANTPIISYHSCYKKPYKEENCFIFEDKFKNSDLSINNYVWHSSLFPLITFKTSYESDVVTDYICPISFKIPYLYNNSITLFFKNETKEIESIVQSKIYSNSLTLMNNDENIIFLYVGNNFYYKIKRKFPEFLVYICSDLIKNHIETGTIDIIKNKDIRENKTEYIKKFINIRELNLKGKLFTLGEEECISHPNATIKKTKVKYPVFIIQNSLGGVIIENELSHLTNGQFQFYLNDSLILEKTKCLDKTSFKFISPELKDRLYFKLPLKIVMITQSKGEQTKIEKTIYVISNELRLFLFILITTILIFGYYKLSMNFFGKLKEYKYKKTFTIFTFISAFLFLVAYIKKEEYIKSLSNIISFIQNNPLNYSLYIIFILFIIPIFINTYFLIWAFRFFTKGKKKRELYKNIIFFIFTILLFGLFLFLGRYSLFISLYLSFLFIFSFFLAKLE